MALSSLTIDLNLGLARFEADSGRAAQIVGRDAQKMAAATATADAAVKRFTASFGQSGVEAKVVRAAMAGASDEALKLFATVDRGGVAFARVGSQGAAAFKEIGASADASLQGTEARILAIAKAARQVRDQAAKLTATAVADNTAGTLSDDGLKTRLASIRAVQSAELDRIAATARADAAADAETLARRQSAQKFLASLNQTASTIRPDGTLKARSELLAEEAAIRGVGAEAQAAIRKIALLEGGTARLGKSAGTSRNQLMTLQYTISDVIASAGSGISPLTILLQQGPQLAQVEGGIKGIFKTGISLVSPFRLAMGGAVAAIGAVGYAWLEGSKQSREFNDAMVLSGNFAGQTEGTFNALAKSIADGGKVTASTAREFGQALIATGEIGPEVFAKAELAAALYGKATGKTAKDVAESFANMTRDAGKWATDQNRSLNFVTAAQLQHIKGLQDSGKATEAQVAVMDLLIGRFDRLEGNLRGVDRVVRDVTVAWDRFWNAAYGGVGRGETVDDRLRMAQKTLERAQAEASATAPIRIYGGPAPAAGDAAARLATAREGLRFAEAAKASAENTAAAAAAAAKLNKQAVEGRGNVESLLKGAKAASEYRKELDKLNRDIEANRKAGTPFTSADEKLARDALKNRYSDKGSRGAEKDAAAERRAQLDKDLQVFSVALAEERDVLNFQQDELRAIYDTGALSLAKYYDDREAAIKRGTQAELDEQAKAIGRLAQELTRGDLKKDERIRLEKQLADAQAKASDIQRDADNAATLATFERAAAVKALAREVDNFQASLADLQGDPLGAAQLRAAQQLEAARTLSTRAGGAPIDVGAYEKALKVANDFAEVQRRASVASANASRAEETYLLRATQGGVGLEEQEKAVYTLRAAALVQLGELAEAAARLADASTDPRVKAYAADLALQYAQAAQAVDPALNRLKASGDELGTSLANVFGDAINNGRNFLDLVNNIGRTVQASITKTLITEPLEQALKGGISKIVQGGNPVGDFLRNAVGVSVGAGGPGQAVAAQAATVSISQLGLAAAQASLALQSIGGASAVAAPASGGFFGNLISSIGGLFGGGGGLIPGGVGAVPYHTGGLVGQGGAARAVSVSTFAGAIKYHGGGMAGLAANEVPAILMGGPRGLREEVLHASDPRHRDNMGAALMQFLGSGRAMRAPAANYTRPSVRYHSGGLAGMAPDAAGFMRAAGGDGRRSNSRGGDIYVTVPPGTSRDTAEQIATRVAQKIGMASRRNG